MYQKQLCIVVLLGEGRCTKNSPVWWCYCIFPCMGLPGATLYGGVIWGGKMYKKFRTSLYGCVIGGGEMYQNPPPYMGCYWGGKIYQAQLCIEVLLGEGRCTRHYSVKRCYLGREDNPAVQNLPVWWCNWGGKIYQAQLCMVVLLGREISV